MAAVRNILFIMCDRLRADHLSCYGHPRLATPNIDRLASLGTKFMRCYVQATVCVPSRMSFYTGRYVCSHGATWNVVPLPVAERTLGDYLRAAGLRTVVAGKSHATPDVEGIRRLGLDPEQGVGLLLAEAGFEPYARHDGIVTEQKLAHQAQPYNAFLQTKGYPGRIPWHDFANSGVDAEGRIASGWYMRNARLPARVPEADSETAWTTDRAIDFMREQGERPWCLHLSYIKPHWPYVAPAPYHALFGPEDSAAPTRIEREREDAHPVYRAFRQERVSQAFARDEVRRTVLPSYMGLVKQVDDHIGRLIAFLEHAGRMNDTMIVFTSDHGDFFGDHWLGDKELFFENSVRIPLIVYDPAPEAVRCVASDALVEAVDLLPTFLEALGQPIPGHVLEGRSLLAAIRGGHAPARDAVFSELDYSFYEARREVGVTPSAARAVMVRTKEWKLVHYDGFQPQLYDLVNDPLELEDRGTEPDAASAREALYDLLFDWMRQRRNRITMSDNDVPRLADRFTSQGVIIGEW